MIMHTAPTIAMAVLALPLAVFHAGCAQAQSLDRFGVLAGSTVTNTGSSVINGNVGVSPGTAIVGFFPPGIVTAPYTIHSNNGVAIQAQIDLVSAFNGYRGRPTTFDLTGRNLGGLVLRPGVYNFDTSAQLTGTVTLDAQNNPNARFIFNIGSTLTTASASRVVLVNGAQGGNVFFVVGSSATLGTSTVFAGDILALTSITLNTGATIICGAALARNGAVTLDTNTISTCIVAASPIVDVVPDLPPGGVGDVFDSVPFEDLPIELQDLISFLTPAELEVALAQLTGEIGTRAAPAGMQLTNAFLSQLFDRMGENTAPLEALPPEQTPATVKTLGYGPAEAPRGETEITAFDGSHSVATVDPRRWTAWVAAYGDYGRIGGDTSFGAHDATVWTGGLSAGLDFHVAPETLVGIAISAGRADSELSDDLGSGQNDAIQAAIYARQNFGAAYIAGAAAFAWDKVSTERTFTVGGNEQFTADYSAYNIAGQIETGYRFLLPDLAGLPSSTGITPFAGLQVQDFHTPGYSETAASGSQALALTYDANRTTSVRTELGVRADHSVMLHDDSILTLRGGASWLHLEQSDAMRNVAFQSLPGYGFTVRGADANADAVRLMAGADIGLVSGFTVGAAADVILSEDSQIYTGKVRLAYSW
jgi:outer membrane autotransporter protein